jgi:hypothetical protein
MKTRILLLAATALTLASCSTVYKSGQTPDDVYYSPGVENTGNVYSDRNGGNEDGYVDLNDRYLRMKSSSRRWSSFDDDFMYWNNPMWNNQFMFNTWNRPMGGMWGSPWMGMGPNIGFNPFFGNGMFMGGFDPFWHGSMWGGSMFGFNNFMGNPFNPFFFGTPVVIINDPLKPISTNPRANGPRTYNLGSYNPRSGYIDPRDGKSIYSTPSGSGRTGIRVFSNTGTNNSGRNGGYISTEEYSRPRGGYNDSWNNSGRGSSGPSRTFDSMGGGSGSSGGGTGTNSGGSAPVRSFPRGGGN